MSYPAYPLPAGTQLPVPTEADNGTRDIAFVYGRLSAGDPWTVITLHRNSHVDANARIVAAGGVIPFFDDVAAFFDDQANNFDYDASAILAREWNLRDGFITEGGGVMSDTQDPFGFFEAVGITPKKRKRFDPHSIILAGNITYVASGRYRLGNTPRGVHEMRQIEGNKGNFCIPVYTYMHSVTRQSTRTWIGRAHHAEWDSAKSGFWYIPLRDIRAMGFTLTEKRKELLTTTLDSILTIIHTTDDPDDEYVEWFRTPR